MTRLSLSVVGAQAHALGDGAEAHWVDRGGSLGRADDNDWVLPDRDLEVSRHHAAIHFVDGGFFLEDTSTNGVCVNQPGARLDAGELYRLADAQILFIGPFQIVVRVDEDARAARGSDHTVVPHAKKAARGGQRPASPARATRSKKRTRTAASATAPDEQALSALLQGAGLRLDHVTADAAARIGRVLKLAVQGVVDLLRSRMAFRNELRLSATLIATREANPLKLSTNAEDALHNLLVKDNPDYLGAEDAVTAAFADPHTHHEAMQEGLRQTFTAMLERFDPRVLEAVFEDRQRRGLVSPRLTDRRRWVLYEEYFESLRGAADADFERIFGEAFVRSYEALAGHGDDRRRRRTPF